MKNNNDLVSVIIPTYNREKTIIRAINSVLNQSYKNLEVIVVDDNSSDSTISLINKIDDKRLKIVKLKKNSGACKARNVGIENANGSIIAFQDSDDEWLEDKIKIQLDYLKENNYDMVFCSLYLIDGSKRKVVPSKKFIFPNNSKDITKSLLIDNYISTQTIVAKKEVFNNIRFDEKFPRFQDWDLVIEISKKFKIGFCKDVLVNLYRQNDSISKNHKNGIKAMNLIFEKNKDIYLNDVILMYYYKKKIIELETFLDKNKNKEIKKLMKEKKDLKLFIIYLINMFGLRHLFLRYKGIKY